MRTSLVLAIAITVAAVLWFFAWAQTEEAPRSSSALRSQGESSATLEALPESIVPDSGRRAVEPAAGVGPASSAGSTAEPVPLDVSTAELWGPGPLIDSQLVRVHVVNIDGRSLTDALRDSGRPIYALNISVAAATTAPEVGTAMEPGTWNFRSGTWPRELDSNDRADLIAESPRVPQFVVALRRSKVIAIQPLAATVDEIDLAIDVEAVVRDDAGLRGRFVDPNGAPVSAQVSMFGLDNEFNSREISSANPGGEFRAYGLAAQALRVECEFRGFAHHTFSVQLVAGQVHDFGTITLQKPAVIAGRLLGHWKDILGRSIELSDLEGEPVAKRVTGVEGDFRFTSVEPGQYLLHVVDDQEERMQTYERVRQRMLADGTTSLPVEPIRRVSSWVLVDTLVAQNGDLQIVLEDPHEVVLRTDLAPGDPIDLVLLDSRGLTLLRKELPAVEGREPLFLIPGTYEVRWSRAGVELGRRRFKTSASPRTILLQAAD